MCSPLTTTRLSNWRKWERGRRSDAIPQFRDYAESTMGCIVSAEAYALLGDIVDDDEQPIDNAVRPRARAGTAISLREYLKALAEREHLMLEVATSFADRCATRARHDDADHPEIVGHCDVAGIIRSGQRRTGCRVTPAGGGPRPLH